MSDKKSLLEKVTPKAVLKAKTVEAKRAIIKDCLGEGIIGIWEFPCRIGRESRIHLVKGKQVIAERHKLSDDSKPNNDIYLVDNGDLLHISREHLQIEKDESGYILTDRHSACGITINDEVIGGQDKGANHLLKDGDFIRIGAENSPYLFEFISLENI
ncbi:MAG: FHA domain-containing protein [Campylobacterota bacterium]|nr:FHA domain-containing protein [Campylobacterota bacterium]